MAWTFPSYRSGQFGQDVVFAFAGCGLLVLAVHWRLLRFAAVPLAISADVAHVVEALAAEGHQAIVVAGYSLGGNLALKLAGDYGTAAPAALKGVAAVSPVMDLPGCVDALERRSNFVYQWNFVRNLKRRMRRKAAIFPGRFSTEPLARIWTVREFDEVYTAPFFGFRDASDYYHRAAALRVVHRIAVPALIMTAADDPFVPPAPFRDPAVTGNPHITVALSAHGGHCGFVAAASPGDDGYWAEGEIVRFAADVAGCAGADGIHV